MSKKILFSLSKAMTIILATAFTILLLVGCPSGTNPDIPAVGTGSNNEENTEKPEAGTEFYDVNNNLVFVAKDDGTLFVIKPIN